MLIFKNTKSSWQFNNVLIEIGVFYGSLRAAGVWAENSIPSDSVALLDECKDAIPVGGKVSAEVNGDLAKMTFNWETIGSGNLLMLALPHHMDTMETNAKTTLEVDVLKGNVAIRDKKYLSYKIKDHKWKHVILSEPYIS